jgi:hypothetical protein
MPVRSHEAHRRARGQRARLMGLLLRRGLRTARRWWRSAGAGLHAGRLGYG